MRTSNKGLDLIKRHEGLKLTAYKCPAGIWTIGYGHTHQVKKGDVIDQDMANEFLKKDVRHAQSTIEKHVIVELDQNQFDALVSFIFNIGSGKFITSTLLKMLNKANYSGAGNQFGRWNKARVKGVLKPLRGLTKRRADEAELFLDYEEDEIAQSVAAPSTKTKLNSKTNMAASIGTVGIIASQVDNISKVIDKVTAVTDKGGDLADKVGAFTNGGLLMPILALAVIGLLGFIIYERNKKVDEHGL